MIGLILSVGLAAAPTLYVETSTLSSMFGGLLAEELSADAIAPDASSADLIVWIDGLIPESLSLTMRDRAGVMVLERTIAIEGGIIPSLRVAVLLVREAAFH